MYSDGFVGIIYAALIIVIIIFNFLGYGRPRRRRYRGVFDYINRRNNYNDGRYYERGFFAEFFANRARNNNRKNARQIALTKAKDFLRPYKDIFGKQILSNKYCILTYKPDKNYPKFTVLSKELNHDGSYPYIEAYNAEHTEVFDDFFNSLCVNFSYNLKFFDVHAIFQKSNFIIKYVNCSEKGFKVEQEKIDKQKYPYNTLEKIKNKEEKIVKRMHKEEKEKQKKKNREIDKININDASEVEITALPGINIVQAKKIIKYRNLNGDFKSIDDFIKYSKVKPHFAEQLKERITIVPKEIKINFEQPSDERIIDLD